MGDVDGVCAEFDLNQVDKHVGNRLRTRRILVQMSEEWLAGMLKVTSETLMRIEEGTHRIGHAELLLCAELLDVPERYFYMGYGETPPEPKRRLPWVRDVDRWFAAHVFPHEGLFFSAAFRLTGNADAARELLQDAYAELLSGSKWTAIAFPRAYVLKAIRSLATRQMQRSRIVSIELLANMDVLNKEDVNPDGFEIVSAKQRRAIILAAVEELPAQCRKVVKLRRLKEMLPRDIAREMGISVSMVEKHLAKGMLHIANRLGDQEPALRSESVDGQQNAAGAE